MLSQSAIPQRTRTLLNKKIRSCNVALSFYNLKDSSITLEPTLTLLLRMVHTPTWSKGSNRRIGWYVVDRSYNKPYALWNCKQTRKYNRKVYPNKAILLKQDNE